MKKIFIDSDLFVMDLRYLRDSRSEINSRFLKKIHGNKSSGVTSIFNLLEVCGILSFNLSSDELVGLYRGFPERYHVKILFPADTTGNLQYDIPVIFDHIQKKQSLGDAQVGYVVERFADQISAFVSWNNKHLPPIVSAEN